MIFAGDCIVSTNPKTMKKPIFLFVMVSFFTQFLNAQIQMESFEWSLNHVKSYPRVECLYTLDMEKWLTFEKEYSVLNVPKLYNSTILYSSTGPQFYVQIDSSLYHLKNYAVFPQPYTQVDRDWIKSISVIRKSASKAICGSETEGGIVVIRLYPKYEDDFLGGEMAVKPIKIK